ncbi:MAG: prolipoprotein diacylglyceryl transferase [Proteobacteria bacterium]|nr:prolipoprotein diacylglyceryl transferase [Pseudomonadota bacterium]
MYPVLIGEGIWALPSYFTMVMIGFFVGSLLMRREAVRVGFSPVKMIDLCFMLVIASIVGARLAHVLFDGFFMDYVHLCFDPDALAKPLPSGHACVNSDQCVAAQNAGYNIGAVCREGACLPERDCLRPFMFWAGGLTYYGGFLLAVGTAWFLSRRWKWSFLKLTDIASPVIALGLAFGRLGCFLAGCCFGKVTDVPWAVRFPQYSDAWKHHREFFPDALYAQNQALGEFLSLPVHPTQLYELFGSLALFAFLWLTRKKAHFEGRQLSILLIGYGILRFVIEIWRDDDRGGVLLSTSQWISIPLILVGCFLIWRGRHRQTAEASGAGTESQENSASGDEAHSEEAVSDAQASEPGAETEKNCSQSLAEDEKCIDEVER